MIPKIKILQEDQSYTFSSYFDLPYETDDILREFDYSFIKTELSLPQTSQCIIDNYTFSAPVAWLQNEDCQEVLLGREVVFDLFDIEFKQAEEKILFKYRGN
ncbi:hypothetical protein PN473_13145 [Dolichospermum circinale CS-545/17]|nr:hypothetical protein [Dolichospermum circinale CS-545/17]